MNQETPRLNLVQLSDPHVVAQGKRLMGRIETAKYLAQAVERVNQITPRPSHVLITGDLVDQGSLDEYQHLRELLKPLPCPYWLMPGNHDSVPQLREAFPDHAYLQGNPEDDGTIAAFVLYELDLGSHRLLSIDTTVPGKPFGTLCAARLNWLSKRLDAQPEMPTLIALHHPPFTTGIAFMDGMGLREGAEELERIVSRHPQVERLLCGHLHRTILRRFGGTLAMTAPSTAHQIALGLLPQSEPAFIFEPPGFYLHGVQADGSLVSHLQPIGDFGSAQRFG